MPAQQVPAGIRFDGRVAIVTGAGRGLGRAYANDLARRGASVVVNDLAADRAERVAHEIEAEGHVAAPSSTSAATADGAREIAEQTIRRFGKIDAIVHNAGILRAGEFEKTADSDLEDVLDVHAKGAFFLTRAAYPAMREAGYGRIVLVCSGAAMFGLSGVTAYAAAKGAVFGLANALALEAAQHGILVNSIVPKAKTGISREVPIPGIDRTSLVRLESRLRPESVAPLVTFLASSECASTGAAFSACAGRFARIFVGVAEGWLAPEANAVAAEDIRDRFSDICALGFSGLVPSSATAEVDEIAVRVARSVAAWEQHGEERPN